MERNTLLKRQVQRLTEEENVYSGVYRLLIAGMVVTSLLFAVGIILALHRPQYFPLSPAWVREQYHWSTLISGLASGNPNAFMMLATVFLILTPVGRVVVSIHAFYVDGDHKYVVVTSAVLLVMIATVVLGAFGLP